MLKNNNQSAVKRLSDRSLKQNRARNIFAVLAIILTTFMFTTVFSIGISLAINVNVMMLRQQGTKTTITLKQPDKNQVEQAKQAKYLHAAGINIPTGIYNDSSGKVSLSLDYYDKTEWEENFTPAISNMEGEYPKKESEIMLSKAALDALKIKKPQKGMNIVLSAGSEERTFQLSGWFTDYANNLTGFQGLVSKAYTDSLGLTVEKDGVLCLSAKAGRQSDLLNELKEKVTLKSGQEFDSTYDVQEENGDTILVVVSAVGLMGLIIILSGYLLIYNVMYISVTKDIRFYGLLKTIGTSPSQIKKMVKRQSAELSFVGIPIGILLGTLLSFAAVPFALRMFQVGSDDIMPSGISFHPFIYVGTITFAIITVAVSCRKPAKLAGKVSAVEALKYHGQNVVKTKVKKSTNGGKLYKMAFRNVFREKKRAILVFASLFMGTMAFLSVNTFIGSMKLENYVDYYLPNDYTIYINSGTEDNTQEEEDTCLQAANRLVEDISKIDGIMEVSVNRSANALLKFDADIFKPFLEQDFTEKKELQEAINFYENQTDEETAYSAPVISVSVSMMEKYNERASQKIDIDRFEKGEVCLMGEVLSKEQADTVRGKKITVEDRKSKRTLTMEVGSCPTLEETRGINIGYFWKKGGAPSCILISEKAMQKLCENPMVNNIIVDCQADTESFVTKKIKDLVKTNSCVLYTEIKSEMISDFQSSMTTMNILGSSISFVLILIGVINFINVMLTGVFTRRNELAVMESVGMTKKQVKKMLICEGAYYGVITLALILTIGNVIIYAVFHYPVGLMLGLAVGIMVICMIVPFVVYHNLSGKSVTERLRNEQ